MAITQDIKVRALQRKLYMLSKQEAGSMAQQVSGTGRVEGSEEKRLGALRCPVNSAL